MLNRIRTRKWFRAAYAVLLTLLMVALFAVSAGASSMAKGVETFSVTGKYYQTESRATLSLINDLRKDGNAWYWKKGDTEKVQLTGLQNLTYDYGLEKIAMQRAAEIAVYYSHTRPDGSSTFSLVIDGVQSSAENIAIFTGSANSTDAFKLLKEDNEKYDGQGHRRNMLNEEFTSVGVAHFEFRGVHLFVQEFGRKNSGKSDPGACNTTATKQVKVNTANLKIGVVCQYSGYEISSGGSANLPGLTIGLKPNGSFADNLCPGLPVAESEYTVSWSSTDESVVTISGSKFVAGKPGEAKLKATVTYKGQTASTSMNVVVKGLSLSGLQFGEIPTQTYSGKPVTIPFVITINQTQLKEGVDYTVTYENNNGPGTATFKITGKGNYTGQYVGTFKIVGNGTTVTNSPTPKPTAVPTKSPTPKPTAVPTKSPTPKPTAVPTKSPTPKPTAVPTKSPTPKPTAVPTKSPTPKPTAVPTKSPTPKPTAVPTKSPTPKPTAVPTKTPTPKPTAVPTNTPTPKATVTVTPVPTATLTPMPVETMTPTVSPLPTVTPELTENPEPTETPGPTGAPEPTGEPEPTGSPEPTENPEVTDVPEPTGEPDLTVTPEPSVTPEEGKTPTPEVTPETPQIGGEDPKTPGGAQTIDITPTNSPETDQEQKPGGSGESKRNESEDESAEKTFGNEDEPAVKNKDENIQIPGYVWLLAGMLIGILIATVVYLARKTKK